jgi:hypothetical protein
VMGRDGLDGGLGPKAKVGWVGWVSGFRLGYVWVLGLAFCI